MIEVISLKQHPKRLEQFIGCFSEWWAAEISEVIYRDCMTHGLDPDNPLPQWYLLIDGEEVIGGCGLITNDFISRMDLYPWLCALYIKPEHRGKGYTRLLVKRCQQDMAPYYQQLYLSTDHESLYEKLGFSYVGDGYNPWNSKSRIYQIKTQ